MKELLIVALVWCLGYGVAAVGPSTVRGVYSLCVGEFDQWDKAENERQNDAG